LTDRPYIDACLRAVPGLGIITGTTSPARYARTRELIADGNDDLRFIANCTGSLTVVQRGREVTLDAGEATLASYAELETVVRPSSGRFVGLHIPFAALAPLVTSIEGALIRPIRRQTEALRLLTTNLEALQHEDMLATPELCRTFVPHVYDLVALAIGATRDAAAIAEGRGGRAARLRAVKADVIQNLGRSDLTIKFIARRHQLQPRYIQRLFEHEGTTFSEFVMCQRLSRSYRMLTAPRLSGRTIGAIAVACGLGDQSYFSRRFRRLYGASPSEVRGSSRQIGVT
jgi:AraC-like DNA-binding protein